MNRLDKIKLYILENYAQPGTQFTAADIAAALGIWRNDASKDLNLLVRDGILDRTATRPVLFSLHTALPDRQTVSNDAAVENVLNAHLSEQYRDEEPEPEFDTGAVAAPADSDNSSPLLPPDLMNSNDGQIFWDPKDDADSAFQGFIGSSGSLRMQIQTAQAAAVYPQYGLHTLIVGETGVGKTTLAKCMHQYMKLAKHDPSIPFVSFNCAEYADNPQLLLAQLFGYEKGAFTGANTAKEGLISQANGGILFLDEIHRLTPVGQEMFFSVIDNGTYRRLGGHILHSADLMIIGATTENITSTLLTTFSRRFPMTICIPALDERPICERFEMILFFFLQEVKCFPVPVRVSNSVISLLLGYKGKANIGHLKNTIQICCARANFRARFINAQNPAPTIDIGMEDVPREILTSYTSSLQCNRYCENVMKSPYLTFTCGATMQSLLEQLNQEVYEINRNFIAMNSLEHGCDIPEKLREFAASHEQLRSRSFDLILGAIPSAYLRFSEGVIAAAASTLGAQYDDKTVYQFALLFDEIINNAKGNRALFHEYLSSGSLIDSPEMEFLTKQSPAVEEQFGVALSSNELAILSMVLQENRLPECEQGETFSGQKPSIRLVLALQKVASGEKTAAFINDALKVDFASYVSLPSHCSAEKAAALIMNNCAGDAVPQAVVVLTNMQSLGEDNTFQKRVHYPALCVTRFNAVFAMEAARQIIGCNETGGDIETLFKSIRSVSFIGSLSLPDNLLFHSSKRGKTGIGNS